MEQTNAQRMLTRESNSKFTVKISRILDWANFKDAKDELRAGPSRCFPLCMRP